MPILIREVDIISPIKGCKLATANAGFRYEGRDDLLLIQLEQGSSVAASFTTNAFSAAPVEVAKQHLQSGMSPQYLLVNSGNANACTGPQGIDDAMSCCELVAQEANVHAQQVLPFSTGVIGETLPVDKFIAPVKRMFDHLSEYNWGKAAKAIMTTDTVPKTRSIVVDTDIGLINISGIAKGSGMINPSMQTTPHATMLAYIATDASIPVELLALFNQQAIEQSFNCITVDGDTSTNDACVLMATGFGVEIDDMEQPIAKRFLDALSQLYMLLAQDLIRDAEGGTKFVTLRVNGGITRDECVQVAKTVGHSPLVKTALFASDPNWGRIIAAIGYAPINDLDPHQVDVIISSGKLAVVLIKNGEPNSDYLESLGQEIFQQVDITIDIHLGRGESTATVWTSDLSYDYLNINASYRT